jgi:hypothetical protein
LLGDEQVVSINFNPWKMSRLIPTVLFTHFFLQVLGQSQDSLHSEFGKTVVSDISPVKRIAPGLFRFDPYDAKAVYYLAESLKMANKTDSLDILFDGLKKLDSTNPQPYIFESLYKFGRISLQDTAALAPLKIAYSLSPNKIQTNRLLGTNYYDLFHESVISGRQENCTFYAQESRKHLTLVCKIDTASRNLLKPAITQLSFYLKDVNFASLIEDAPTPSDHRFKYIPPNTSYFPLRNLVTLPLDYEQNFKYDLVHIFNVADHRSRWYSRKLYDMEEPLVYNQKEKTIYRFIWLRSFHSPIVIRVEKLNDSIQLTWKLASGAGGYSTGDLVTNKSKTVSVKDWQKFLKLLTKAKYWQLDAEVGSIGADGAQWIIEGLSNNRYHIVDRWSSNKLSAFQKCAIYLLSLTDIVVPQKDIY